MPIRIPSELPALEILSNENIFVMEMQRAMTQDIRPMQVGILNLMPNKIETEVQILRLLSNTPLQINIDLIRIDNSVSKNTPQSHMDAFYKDFSSISNKQYDGLIITGAPLGFMDYEAVTYWDDITAIFDWAQTNVQSTLYLCWAAHAAMYHFHGVVRDIRAQKLSGVFEHQVLAPTNELMRGFDPVFWAPHSRFGDIPVETYANTANIQVLAASDVAGAYICATEDKRNVFITGHPEYDWDTLAQEYARDLANGSEAGKPPLVPMNYFVDDDPEHAPIVRWRSHGTLLYTNWLNYYVYQTTPYDLTQLATGKR
ncbi:MAG: homoserine O-succinyltransferase [Alteromonadaceae bacterium]|nr:homoserine O-succinyltransferase [Alteromonadaceae bacterium]